MGVEWIFINRVRRFTGFFVFRIVGGREFILCLVRNDILGRFIEEFICWKIFIWNFILIFR